MPIAATTHSVAAVVRPRTLSPCRMIAPAPRKPIPLTTWAARTRRRTTWAQPSSGKHRRHRPLLRRGDLLDPARREIEQLVELGAAEALALRGRLNLDQPPVAAHDDVDVDLGA